MVDHDEMKDTQMNIICMMNIIRITYEVLVPQYLQEALVYLYNTSVTILCKSYYEILSSTFSIFNLHNGYFWA